MEALRNGLCRAIKLGAVLGVSLSCAPGDIVEIPEELRGDPYCLFVTGTDGYFENGSTLLIADWDQSLVLGGCVCATQDEIKAGTHDDEMNERALEECQRFAAKQDFVSDECLENYEAGVWLGAVFSCEPGSDWENVPPPDLHCAGT